MSFIFGGGGGGQTTTGTQTVTQREAPEIEARKLSLYDQASQLASSPVNLPAIQVAPISGIEQAAIRQAGQTGVGASTVQSGISALQQGMQAPNIQQFFNPFQNYVTAEIGRQGQIAQNQLAGNAVAAGAFGGGRQGVAQAELQKRTLEAMGQAQAQGFQTALQAAQNQRQQQLAGGVSLGQLGQQQQAMNLADIQAQLQAGALQRGIGQQQLDAQRSTALQRAYEPFQRIEFLKGIMTNLPTAQSTITSSTAPGANPLGQAVGAGLGAYSAYNLMQPR
jgi:hypothetical protein|tara:strand:- start:6 stop:842 length:837 start_codon:yes stop_codon:yes gene_type:complete